MKKIFFVLLCLVSCNAYAYSYSVSGEDENGNSVEGEVYSTPGSQDVSGEITDENGNTHDFTG